MFGLSNAPTHCKIAKLHIGYLLFQDILDIL